MPGGLKYFRWTSRWHLSSDTMTLQSYDSIYALATRLFCKDDWPDLRSSLDNCLPSHSKVLWDNGIVAAFVIVTCGSTQGCAQIAFCGVDPRYQGKGYGSKLLKEAIQSIFQVDYMKCQLIVDGWNVDARRLYERMGFCVVAPYKVAHTDGFLMELTRPCG